MSNQMDEILSKHHYRKTFFTLVLLILVLAMVLRFYTLPVYDSTLKYSYSAFFALILDNLVVSLFISVFIGAFIFWITPKIVKRSVMEVIDPKEINPLLKAAANTTKFWIYKGACGRYTRATTLPMLADAARFEGIGRDITICLLNPQNEELCEEYATYRQSLKSGKGGVIWTQQVVQDEILATAICALKYHASQPLLRVRVFFVENFSVFRLDVSDKYVVITKEDKDASALRADAGTYFYDSYKDDIRLTERQATELLFPSKLDITMLSDEAYLRQILKSTNLFDEAKLDTSQIKKIIERVNKPADPY